MVVDIPIKAPSTFRVVNRAGEETIRVWRRVGKVWVVDLIRDKEGNKWEFGGNLVGKLKKPGA